MSSMHCFSDLLLFKEYIQIISDVKGPDPEPAGTPASTVAVLNVLSETLASFPPVAELPRAFLKSASHCLQLGNNMTTGSFLLPSWKRSDSVLLLGHNNHSTKRYYDLWNCIFHALSAIVYHGGGGNRTSKRELVKWLERSNCQIWQ